MSKIGDLIYSRRKELGLTLEEVGNAVGVGKSTVKKWENGFISNMRRDKIEKLAAVLQVSPIQLLGIESNVGEVMSKDKIRMIPVFESVSAGFGASASEHIVDYMPLYIEHDYDAENSLAIKVIGNSMYPKIEDGDLIAVRKQSDFENGQVVVVLIDGDEGLVKKIYQDKNKITLVSFNPEYPDKVFTGEEINRLSIVGVVKQVIKTL